MYKMTTEPTTHVKDGGNSPKLFVQCVLGSVCVFGSADEETNDC